MNEEKDKKTYELALLVKGEADLAPVAALVREHRGEIASEPRAKKLTLAYKIKGAAEAVFASLTFRASGSDAKNLEHDLRTRPEVLRSLILVAPPQAERQPTAPPAFPPTRRGRPPVAGFLEPKPVAAPRPLSNEALEKKIEEILQ